MSSRSRSQSQSQSQSRYSSFESQAVAPSESVTSSAQLLRRPKSLLKHTNEASELAVVKVKKEQHHLAAMLKKFMEKSSTCKPKQLIRPLPPPPPANNKPSLPRKLFQLKPKALALTEVKANTRTLAMVLRSERELLTSNQDQLSQIAHLTSLLHHRTSEVEKLKDLCLKQREEIKALKTAILFPDDMNSQLEELFNQQGSQFKQANRVIPTLQKQISSLTGQLQCLSQDLAEVRATRSIDDSFSIPRTPVYDQEEAANSLDFSSDELPDSPDNMLLKDMNPCLTPCYSRMKSKQEFEAVSYSYSKDARKLSTSVDHLYF